MRFMMIIKGNKDTEAGVMPEEKTLAAMAKFNQELADAGVMLDGAGLQPSEKGARVRFSGGKPTVIDGPFGEPRDLIAGFWMISGEIEAGGDRMGEACPVRPGRAYGR